MAMVDLQFMIQGQMKRRLERRVALGEIVVSETSVVELEEH